MAEVSGGHSASSGIFQYMNFKFFGTVAKSYIFSLSFTRRNVHSFKIRINVTPPVGESMSRWMFPGLSFNLTNGFDDRKTVHRTLTPSTACDEDGDIANWDSDANSSHIDRPRIMPPVCHDSNQRRRSRGLTEDQFLSAVRSPFLFPSPSNVQGRTPIPVCIICRNRLQGGDSCRELVGCGHCFHSDCVEDYFQNHSRCPVCRARCRPPSSARGRTKRIALRQRARPCWTPEYDMELLSVSDRVDRERRARIYLTKGVRDDAPQSQVFLKSSLPVVLEECPEDLGRDDGSLVSLCKSLHREKEKRILSSIKNWNRDMQKLAVAFVLSVVVMYLNQKHYVQVYLKLCHKSPKKEFKSLNNNRC